MKKEKKKQIDFYECQTEKVEFCIIQYQIVQIEYWEFNVYFVLDEEDE